MEWVKTVTDELNARLAAPSPNVKQAVAREGGHYIHIDKPGVGFAGGRQGFREITVNC